MLLRISLIFAVVFGALSIRYSDASACGPEFSVDLLSQRPTTMANLPRGSFVIEAQKLIAPPTTPYLVQMTEPSDARNGGSEVERSLYDLGASHFNRGDYEAAEREFEALLKLPPEQRQYRSTWAAYMLGRIHFGEGDVAIEAYELVRTLVADGFRDDLGLAVSSLGQQAFEQRLFYNDEFKALKLYAQQASHGDEGGALSLLLLVRAAMDGQVEAYAQDPIGQALLMTYLYTRRHELSGEQAEVVWEELAKVPIRKGAGLLAAAAYREGKWELAQRFASQETETILSNRVLGKLALRAGNLDEAAKRLAKVESAQHMAPERCSEQDLARVASEQAVFALREGRIMDAMNAIWSARLDYGGALYVAERVLTLDELRSFLTTIESKDLDENIMWNLPSPEEMRPLFARRLMRAGFRRLRDGNRHLAKLHFDEAQQYFGNDYKQAAREFAKWMLRAAQSGDPIEHADSLYRASQIARKQGMGILGTSVAPDWASVGGSVDVEAYTFSEEPGTWMGEEERRRVEASAPISPQRYHYRSIASVLAEEAADLLPHQSQAFAVTLCHSTRYIFNTDRERVANLWARYVREGPAGFGNDFGVTCAEPEMVAARRFLPSPKDRSLAWLWGVLPILLLGLFLLRLWRRRVIHRGRIGEL